MSTTEIAAQTQRGDNVAHGNVDSREHNLSQQAFANPVDFLTTLQSIMPKVNPQHPDDVSRNDLIVYASQGGDSRGRAAAAIAAAHYDQLRQLPNVSRIDSNDPQINGLSAREIGLDIDLAKGDVQGELTKRELINGGLTASLALATAGLGAVTAASLEIPPLAALSGFCTVAVAAVVGINAVDLYNLPHDLQAKATQDQHVLAGWPGINGDK
jgi:hypothetical protein